MAIVARLGLVAVRREVKPAACACAKVRDRAVQRDLGGLCMVLLESAAVEGWAAAGAGEATAPATAAPAGGGLADCTPGTIHFITCRAAARTVDQSSSDRHEIQLQTNGTWLCST